MTRDYGGRRPAERPANVLPTGRSRLAAPEWPLGEASGPEADLWADLWRRPVAALWRAQHIAPVVIARYVRVLAGNPASPSLVAMESALALTPAALARLHVTFEEPRPALSVAGSAALDAARKRSAG